jgi:hypothetical protein
MPDMILRWVERDEIDKVNEERMAMTFNQRPGP